MAPKVESLAKMLSYRKVSNYQWMGRWSHGELGNWQLFRRQVSDKVWCQLWHLIQN